MKNKTILSAMILFLLFIVLIFATSFMDASAASNLWIVFFGIVGLILIIWIVVSVFKNPEENSIESFKNQHAILQVLEIIFIVSLILEIITVQNIKIAGYILFLILIIKLISWFFKKEE